MAAAAEIVMRASRGYVGRELVAAAEGVVARRGYVGRKLLVLQTEDRHGQRPGLQRVLGVLPVDRSGKKEGTAGAAGLVVALSNYPPVRVSQQTLSE